MKSIFCSAPSFHPHFANPHDMLPPPLELPSLPNGAEFRTHDFSKQAPQPMSHSACVAAAAAAEAKQGKRPFHSHRAAELSAMEAPGAETPYRPRTSTASTPLSATMLARTAADAVTPDPLCDDPCMLCDTCLKDSDGHCSPGLPLDDPPPEGVSFGRRRWQKLPCRCADRFLHVACLETAFFESSIRRRGRRQLRLVCRDCGASMRVTRRRGRRICDHQAWLSFARHLLSVMLIAGFLLTFGIWSMLHYHSHFGRAMPNAVNIILVASGCGVLLAFASYELWQLYGRFEFVIVRLATSRSPSRLVENELVP